MDGPEGGTRIDRVGADSGDRLEALLRGAGDHLEPLLDVGTTPSGDLVLVLPRPAARLPELLEVAGWPTAGEAVTVVVPLCAALERMHTAGVAHGGVGPSAVVLDDQGTPALAAPIAPVLRERAGRRAFDAAVADDVHRLGGLADALLARAGHEPVSAADGLAAMAEALFDLADARPVRLRPALSATTLPATIPARLTDPQAAEVVPVSRLAPLVDAVRRVRRRTWALAAGAAVALLAAVVLLPGGGAGVAAPGSPRRTASAPAPTSVPRTATGADALRRLVTVRAGCLARSDDRCLAAVETGGSPVAVQDLAALRSGADPVGVDPGRLRVVADTGATVTAEAGRVVVLAVREPGGWRLRDVIARP